MPILLTLVVRGERVYDEDLKKDFQSFITFKSTRFNEQIRFSKLKASNAIQEKASSKADSVVDEI